MPQANLDRLELDEERGELGDIDAATATVFRSLGTDASDADNAYLEQTVRELLIAKRDLVDRLVNDLDAYVVDLSELEVSNRSLIEETQEFADFLDEHVLWIRSADALKLDDLTAAGETLLRVADPRPWMTLVRDSGLHTWKRPLVAIAVLFCAALLITFHARLRRRIGHLCETRSCSAGVRFWPTVEAILLAMVVAAEWPLLLYYFGWQIATADSTSDLALAIGPTLQYIAVLLWLSEFVRLICRAEGIAEVFFDWSAHGMAMVRREIWWLTLLGIPLAGLTHFAQIYDQGVATHTVGRLAFLTLMLLLSASAHFLLHSKENMLREAMARDPQGWLSRVRYVAYALSLAVPMLLAILAAIGFYYSAQQLALRLQTTLAVVLTVILLHALLARWFLVRRRALAMQQARERQLRAVEGMDGADEQPGSPATLPPVDDQADLSAIHSQLQVLLRHALTVCILASSWFIWSDVLPAPCALDRVVFWEKTIDVTETFEDADGILVRQQYPKVIPTTLRHGLIACAVLLVTFTLGRNLPALLAIALLNKLPFDRGGRHAVSVILHYLVGLTGLLLACRTLHIDWSSIQWLAAGITVGLGFGLQEIFANFISGLILLFERPIRVGDIITLGDITGSVTNIRIRATTVTNWDRKELIVPNKELVTGRLLNWTLSDTTNRIVIEVGVAYHTDPEEAREVLLTTVQQHPNVLADPAPQVTFEGFGDSTLNLVIRAYVATMDVRLQTIHTLHSQIFQQLKEAKIEIAFPQRDVNLRVMSSAALPADAITQAMDQQRPAA